ncbi:MAG: 23S rRNA (pseudouridine(1915)-N(3))-methyltransferase RlmH [Candidatus Saccharibacteria bacterium]
MTIKIIAVGKKHESWVLEGIQRYQKRLKRPFDLEWVILPHSSLPNDRARQEESQRISLRLNANDYVILMDETGKPINSIDFSKLLTDKLEASKQIVVIIGGAFGVDDSIKKRADFVWSLSPLVLPHQLVRLVLTEQIYRAQEISNGNPYHHS